eukprot:6316-Heterococcus_DN1.PRE.1
MSQTLTPLCTPLGWCYRKSMMRRQFCCSKSQADSDGIIVELLLLVSTTQSEMDRFFKAAHNGTAVDEDTPCVSIAQLWSGAQLSADWHDACLNPTRNTASTMNG